MATVEGPAHDAAREQFRTATAEMSAIRSRAALIVKDVTGVANYGDKTGDTPKPDVNYVFPTFVTTRLPQGLVGLIIAAIFAAAMSATAGELSATATATVIDVYKRLLNKSESDAHYLLFSRLAVAFWGIVACIVAHVAVQLGSLIEVVNRIGSIFYGSLLGVFVLALTVRRANGHGAFIGLLSGILFVVAFAFNPATRNVSYLWHNPIGVVVVMVVGTAVSLMTNPQPAKAAVCQQPHDHHRLLACAAVLVAGGLAADAPAAARQAARYDLRHRRRHGDRRHRPRRRVHRRRDQGRPDRRRSAAIPRSQAAQVIDASGLIVAPGFVDVHTHADNLVDRPAAANFVRMGVTTIVAGNCGGSALDVGAALSALRESPGAVNFATLIGHNTVRSAVMGSENRPPRVGRARADAVARLEGDGRRRDRLLDRPAVRARHLRAASRRSSTWRAWPPTPAASTPRTCGTRAPSSSRRSPKPSGSAR